jgi:hypothetical protein
MADDPNAVSPAKLEADAWRIATAFERTVESIPLAGRTYQLNRIHATIAEMRGQDAARIYRLLEDHPAIAARAKRQNRSN